MKTHRRIIRAGALTAIAIAAIPVSANANPLLSGYGGPGQGSQAILGSQLLGGGGGGGNGSSAGSQAAPAQAASLALPVTSSEQRGKGGAHPRASLRHTAGLGRGSTRHPEELALYRAAERGGAPSAPALGLSGADLLFIGLAFAGLAFMGLFTRRLARGGPARSNG